MDALTANDTVGVYPASYYAATARPLRPFPALRGQVACDVCVVGAGFTGVSAALHLAERGYDVVLLDAHRIGWGASGRNGGQVGTGQRLEQSALEELVGKDDARRLWQIGLEAHAQVLQLTRTFGIDAEYRPGVLHVDHRSRFSPHSRREVEHLRSHYGYEPIRYAEADEVAHLLGTPVYHGGSMDMGSGHLHPLKLVFGLAEAAIEAGAQVFERSRVTAIEEKNSGVEIVTEGGRVTAQMGILAGNGYLSGLAAPVERRFVPINNFIIATEPLGADRARAINRDDVAVSDSRFVINYWRLSRDNRLLFGGGETYGLKFPADLAAVARKPLLKIYPQLADVRIDYAWGGTLAITRSRLPVFARVSPHVLSAGGYSGHGIALGVFAGEILAQAVSGTMERFDVMAKVPNAAFPGGTRLRHPLLVAGMTFHALRDLL